MQKKTYEKKERNIALANNSRIWDRIYINSWLVNV